MCVGHVSVYSQLFVCNTRQQQCLITLMPFETTKLTRLPKPDLQLTNTICILNVNNFKSDTLNRISMQ